MGSRIGERQSGRARAWPRAELLRGAGESECRLNTQKVWEKLSKAPAVVGRSGGQLEPPSKRLGMM